MPALSPAGTPDETPPAPPHDEGETPVSGLFPGDPQGDGLVTGTHPESDLRGPGPDFGDEAGVDDPGAAVIADEPEVEVDAVDEARSSVSGTGPEPSSDPATAQAGTSTDRRSSIAIRTGRYRTHRPVRTAIISLCVASLLVAVAASAGLLYLKDIVNDIPRIGGGDLQVTPAASGKPTTFMIVGNDTREGLGEALADDAGVGRPQTAGARADTIILIHVDPARKKSFVLSLPRDLRVEIPGRGPDKVNAALAYGGEQLLVDTVQGFTGLTVNHYVQVNFQSFADMVDAVGGVEYDFPYPIRDTQLKWRFESGPQVLDGRQALMLVRSRHFQEQIDGKWVGDGKGDFGRIERQQEFLLKLLGKVNGAGSVTRVKEFARIAKEHMKVDAHFDFDAALDLYRQMTPITPENVQFVSLPAKPTMRSGVSYIEALPEAEGILAALRGESSGQAPPPTEQPAPPAADPGVTRVRVLNATDQKALAANTRLRLENLGFAAGAIGDSPDPRKTSVVYYAPGALAKGMLVGQTLQIEDVQPGTVGNSDVLVVLGNDFRLPELAPSE